MTAYSPVPNYGDPLINNACAAGHLDLAFSLIMGDISRFPRATAWRTADLAASHSTDIYAHFC